MERRASRIVKAVVLLVGILLGVFLLLWVLMCLAACLSSYLRRLVLAMNDEAAPADDDVDDALPPLQTRQLDKASIDKLPLVVYHRAEDLRRGEDEFGVRALVDCGVCLADFQEMEALRLLPACQHCFHPSCIDTWLSSHSTCPLCRQSIAPDCNGRPNDAAAGPRLFSVVNMMNDLGSPPVGRA
ncbi:hypothetical protein L7F22_022985 [Adiantum nelumboides]|nr:hypothetical protein [Adiantum nelumboides]